MPNSRRPLTAALMLLLVYVSGYGVLRSQDVLHHFRFSPVGMMLGGAVSHAARSDCHSIPPQLFPRGTDWFSQFKHEIATPAAQLYMPLCWCEAQVWGMFDKP